MLSPLLQPSASTRVLRIAMAHLQAVLEQEAADGLQSSSGIEECARILLPCWELALAVACCTLRRENTQLPGCHAGSRGAGKGG